MRGPLPAVTVLGAALLLPASPAVAGDPVMPLEEVRPGMQCTGYSVFRGTAVEPFDVEVLDVVGSSTTGGPTTRILVRVSGERVERTGIGPGFSGSPIYCPRSDGTPASIGAISESIGDYGGKTVLATPIEAILATPLDAPAPAGRVRAAGRRDAALLARSRPLTAPLTVRGLSRSVQGALARVAARRGVALLQAPPAPARGPDAAPLVPGSAVGVGISSGDIAVGAVGTVAYTDAADVWLFGHPFEGVGGRALLLQDAHVSAVIENPIQTAESGTYKLAGPVNDVGTVTYDGFEAVTGRIGGLPPVTPVRVYTRDLDRGLDAETLVRVADETDVGNPTGFTNVSFVGPLAVTEAASQALGAAPLRVAGRMCFRVVLRERRRPLRFCNRYVSDGTFGGSDGFANAVALSAGTDAAEALSLFDFYRGRPVHLEEVSARITMTRGQHMAYLRRVELPRVLRRGSTVPARLVVKLVRGKRRTIPFRWHVPRSLPTGRQTLTFRGTEPDGADDFFGAIEIFFGDGEYVDPEGPRTLRRLADAFAAIERYDGVRLRRPRSRVYRDDDLRIGGRARTTVRVRRAGR